MRDIWLLRLRALLARAQGDVVPTATSGPLPRDGGIAWLRRTYRLGRGDVRAESAVEFDDSANVLARQERIRGADRDPSSVFTSDSPYQKLRPHPGRPRTRFSRDSCRNPMTRLITRCPRGDLPTNLRIDLGSKERERGWPRLGSNQQPSACEAEAKSEPRRVFPPRHRPSRGLPHDRWHGPRLSRPRVGIVLCCAGTGLGDPRGLVSLAVFCAVWRYAHAEGAGNALPGVLPAPQQLARPS